MKKSYKAVLMKALFILPALLFFFGSGITYSQSSPNNCTGAASATMQTECELQDYSFDTFSTEYWIKFTATQEAVIIKADTNIYDPAHLHSILLYSGNCGTLTLLDSIDATDTLQLHESGLVTGNDYYIQVKRSDPSVCNKTGCEYGIKNFRMCIRGGFQISQFCVQWPNGIWECCDPEQPINGNNFTLLDYCISQTCTNTPICVGVYAPGLLPGDPNYHITVNITAPGSSIAPPTNFQLDDVFTPNCFPLSYPVEGVYPVTYSFFDNLSQNTLTYTIWLHVVDQNPDFTFSLAQSHYCNFLELCQDIEIWFNDTTTHLYFSINNPTPSFLDVITQTSFLPDYCTSASLIDLCPGKHTATVIGCSPSRFNSFIPNEYCACDTITYEFTFGPRPEFTYLTECDTLYLQNITECADLSTPPFFNDFVWDMGDGTFITGYNPPPFYVYANAGTYNVSLTINYNYGNCNEVIVFSDSILISKPFDLEIEGPTDNCCDTVTYFCSNCPPGGTTTWEFFNTVTNQTFLTSGNPVSYIWPYPGLAVGVTYEDTLGCVSDTTIAIKECCTPVQQIPGNAIQTGYCNDTVYSTQFFTPYFVPSTNIVQNYYIVLQSDLIVNGNLQFKNCEIRVAPGRKITVNPGVNFQIRETKVKALCTEMWDGIYLDDPSSAIFIGGANPSNPADDSEIWDAINGVVCSNGASFTINDVKLTNNYASLQVFNFNGMYPGTITNTLIQTTSSNLYSPHAGQRMKYGIRVAGVQNITIGNVFTQANEFANMDFGIYLTESSARIFGNKFTGINRPFNLAPCPTCIDHAGTAIFSRSKLAPVILTVGNNTLVGRNDFNQCYIGVKVYDNVALTMRQNRLKHMEEAGIYTHFNANKTHTISSNFIQHSFHGIHGLHVVNCTLNITNNTIKNATTNCGGPCIDNTGILVENFTPANVTVNIVNNDIDRKRVGIWLRFVNSPQSWPNNSANIFSNTVHFGPLNNNVVPFY